MDNQLLKMFLIFCCIAFSGGYRLSGQSYLLTTFDANGKVTIKANVPNAKTVALKGTGGSWGLYNLNLNFENKGNGLWQLETDTNQIAPGFHYYNFVVNGYITVNPNEKVYTGSNSCVSGIDVPDPNVDFYSIKDVSHGTVRMELYNSTTTKKGRRCFIYLPPGYDGRADKRYPILFLQHGNGESEYSWHMQGKVNFILDNLIAEGKAEPMIVVMDNGMTANYSPLVLNDLIPLLEKNYKVKTGKKNRAVAGLSMGAAQAILLALTNTDKFSYLGWFSDYFDYNPASFFKNVNINDSLTLFWYGWGKSDEYKDLFTQSIATLNLNKVNYVYTTYVGGHEWQVWRNCLHDFAPLLFKPYVYANPFPHLDLNPTGVETQIESALKVYPNPFAGNLRIDLKDLDGENLSNYELYDSTGRKILEFKSTKTNAEQKISDIINRSQCNLFILSILTKQINYKVKIIKQN